MIDLTIIVPAYNVAKSIGGTLKSIFAQQTKYTYEVLSINGPSTDDTREVVASFLPEHPNLRPIEYDQKNLLGARLLGLKHAQGRYVTFCDGDDEEAPNAVETMVSALDESGADVVSCGFYFVKKKSTRPTFFRRDKTYDRREFYKAMLSDTYVRAYLWCKAFRRELFVMPDMVTPKENLYREDTLFLFVFCRDIKKAVTVKTPTYYYDKRGDSGFSGASRKRVADFVNVLAIERITIERMGDEELLRHFRKMKTWRKWQLLFDLWFNRQAFDKAERKAAKEKIRYYLGLFSSPDPLPIEGMPWEEFFPPKKETENK